MEHSIDISDLLPFIAYDHFFGQQRLLPISQPEMLWSAEAGCWQMVVPALGDEPDAEPIIFHLEKLVDRELPKHIEAAILRTPTGEWDIILAGGKRRKQAERRLAKELVAAFVKEVGELGAGEIADHWLREGPGSLLDLGLP